MILGVVLLTVGVAIGGSAVILNRALVRDAVRDAEQEIERLQKANYRLTLERERDIAWREGYREGRTSPVTRAERFAQTFEGLNVQFGGEKEGA